MKIDRRLTRIEQALRGYNCEACAAGETQMLEASTNEDWLLWLQLFFRACPDCGAQNTWRDLVALAGDDQKRH